MSESGAFDRPPDLPPIPWRPTRDAARRRRRLLRDIGVGALALAFVWVPMGFLLWWAGSDKVPPGVSVPRDQALLDAVDEQLDAVRRELTGLSGPAGTILDGPALYADCGEDSGDVIPPMITWNWSVIGTMPDDPIRDIAAQLRAHGWNAVHEGVPSGEAVFRKAYERFSVELFLAPPEDSADEDAYILGTVTNAFPCGDSSHVTAPNA